MVSLNHRGSESILSFIWIKQYESLQMHGVSKGRSISKPYIGTIEIKLSSEEKVL